MSFVDQALEILGNIGDNKSNLQALEQHRTRLVPFVGAGLSMPYGYPNWSELLRSLSPDDKTRAEVDVLLKHYQYEEAADVIADVIPPKTFREKLKGAFSEVKLPKPLGGATSILPAFANSIVITTNLDRAIEHAYVEAGLPFQTILRGGDLREGSQAIQRGERCLIKLHGDYEDKRPVLTLDAYNAAYGSADPSHPDFDRPLPDLLRIALTGRPLLFLGCSLQADRTVRVIARVVKKLGVEHFAVLSSADNTGERRAQFREWNLKPLFFEGRDYPKVSAFLDSLPTADALSPVKGTVNAMVREVRARTETSIRARCGTIKILDMEQAIGLGTVYTEVNILQKLESRKRKTIEEFKLELNSESFDRFGLHAIEQKRVSGPAAVQEHLRLLVYGKPGAGKTTFLKRLAIECIEARLWEHLVPAFVPLREYADSPNDPSLADYLVNDIGTPYRRLIEEGRVFVLLDGLDEVRDADSRRIHMEVDKFIRSHPNLRVVMTCRIAAREYAFEQFCDVEMADFDQDQIVAFSQKWFIARNRPEFGERFMKRLQVSEQLLELATRPLLLTLLCTIFEERGDFDGSRAKLYHEGIETLIRRWDAKRGIARARELSVDELERLLENIAYENFVGGRLLLEQADLHARINEYFRTRRKSGQLPNVDRVLNISETQLGLLVQRAKGIYSFSHLTFQEFFTARRIAANEDLIDVVVPSLAKPSWREVWLLLADQKDPEFLIPRLQGNAKEIVARESGLRPLFDYAGRKSVATDATIRIAPRGVIYLWMSLTTSETHAWSRARKLAEALDPRLASNFMETINQDAELALDLVLDRTYREARRAGFPSSDLRLELRRSLELASVVSPELAAVLEWLTEGLSTLKTSKAKWLSNFETAIVELRDIGYRWQLTEAQLSSLDDYFAACILLVDMMKQSRNLTKATRQIVEIELLRPYAKPGERAY